MSESANTQAQNPTPKIVEDQSNLAKPQAKTTPTPAETTPAQPSGTQVVATTTPAVETKENVANDKKVSPSTTPEQTAKPDAKVEAKLEAKVETKVDAKPDAKVEAKVEAKGETKVETKPQAPVVQQDFKTFLSNKNFNELSLVMKEPEKIDANRVKDWHEAEKFSHKRVDTMKHFNTDFYSKENQFVHKERRFLDKAEEFLDDFTNQIVAKITENQKTIAALEQEIQKLEPKKAESQAGLDKIEAAINSLQAKITEDRNEILTVIKDKEGLAGKINPEELKNIKIKDEKSPINLIFQWVIVVVYGENLSKYDWDNFKTQAFKKDKGVDFSDRLRGFNVNRSKVDPSISKTVQEKKTEILAEAEKKGTNQSLRYLFDYAALIKKVSDDLEDIKQTEASLAEKKQELEKKKNVHSETVNHILGIESQLKILKTYNTTFGKVNELLKNTTEITSKRSNNQDAYLEKYGGAEPAEQAKEAKADEEAELKKAQAAQALKAQQAAQSGAPAEQAKLSVEEDSMGGAKASPKKAKKEVKSAVTTDLGETKFADKKEGGCEGCNIF